MKQGHFAILFCIPCILCFLSLMYEKVQYENTMMEKQRVEEALLCAAEWTAKEYASVINESEERKKQVVSSSFPEMLRISLGLLETEDSWKSVRLFLPLLMVAEEDGVWFCYLKEVEKDGIVELEQCWSEKTEFEEIEENVSWYITNHNYIAAQYGMEYTFFVPDFFKSGKEQMEFPVIIAVFQGWPLNASGNIVYENCMDVAVYLQKKEYFLLEYPTNLADTRCYFHREECLAWKPAEDSRLWVTEEDAVCIYGAFPCEKCIPR